MPARAAVSLLAALLCGCQSTLGLEADTACLVQKGATSSDFPWPWNFNYNRVDGRLVATRKEATETARGGVANLAEHSASAAAAQEEAEEEGKAADQAQNVAAEAATEQAEQAQQAAVEAAPEQADQAQNAAVEAAPEQADQAQNATVEAAPEQATEESSSEDDAISVKLIDKDGNTRLVKAHKGRRANGLIRIVCGMAHIAFEACTDQMKFILNNKKVIHPKDSLAELGLADNDVVRMMHKTTRASAAAEAAPEEAERAQEAAPEAAPKRVTEESPGRDDTISVKLIDKDGNTRLIKAHKGSRGKMLIRTACSMAQMSSDGCSDNMKLILNDRKVIHPTDTLAELGLVDSDVLRLTSF